MFENPRRGRQARNFTTKVPKILGLKSSSEQRFSKNWRWVPLTVVLSFLNFFKIFLLFWLLCFGRDGEKDFYIITIRFSAGDGDLDRLLLALMGTLLWLRVSGFTLNFCLILEEFPGIIFTYMQFILLPLFVSNLAWPLTKDVHSVKADDKWRWLIESRGPTKKFFDSKSIYKQRCLYHI